MSSKSNRPRGERSDAPAPLQNVAVGAAGACGPTPCVGAPARMPSADGGCPPAPRLLWLPRKLRHGPRGPQRNPSDPKRPTTCASPEHCEFRFYKETSPTLSFNGFIRRKARSSTQGAWQRRVVGWGQQPIPQHIRTFRALNTQCPLKTIRGETMLQVPF